MFLNMDFINSQCEILFLILTILLLILLDELELDDEINNKII